MSIPRRQLGRLSVSAVGIGVARLALLDEPDEAITSVVHAALDEGITLFDTARAYTPPGVDSRGERVLAAALKQHPEGKHAVVLTKGGHERHSDGSFSIDGRPEVLRRHCTDALVNLGSTCLDAFLLHWPDEQVPITESAAALGDLRAEGLARLVGLCNVDVDQVRAAHDEVGVDLVQNPYSGVTGGDEEVIAFCRENGIGHVAYSPLGGTAGARALGRFESAFAAVAQKYDASAHEAVLAWLLASQPGVVPVVGAGRPGSARAAARAGTIELDNSDLRELGAILGRNRIGASLG